MKRKPTFILVLSAALALVGSAPASAEIVTNTSIPFDEVFFIPCANGGTGESVELTGNLHVLITETIDDQGGAHFTQHFQPMGISGIGFTTGALYRGTGVTRDGTTITTTSLAMEATFVNNFRIIGQGKGNNFLVHSVVHVTVDANGDVTADVSLNSTDCK